jgi:VanZ family protein
MHEMPPEPTGDPPVNRKMRTLGTAQELVAQLVPAQYRTSLVGIQDDALSRPTVAMAHRPAARSFAPAFQPPALRRLSRLLVTLAIAAIALATLFPAAGPPPGVSVFCVLCGEVGTPDLLLNIALFLPLGMALAYAGASPLRAALLALALSATIEALQLLLPGRAPTVRDVVTNALGGWLGALLVLRLHALLRPSPRTAILAWLAAAAPALVVAGAGALRSYALPNADYFLMIAPRQPHLARWDGGVGSVTLNGARVFAGRQREPVAMREALLAGRTFEVTGSAGPPTERLAGMVSIADGRNHQLFLVGPDGDDLVVFTRRRAATFRLAEPPTRFRDALAGLAPGDPFTIRASGSPDSVCATVNGVEACAGRPAAGGFWQLFRPLDDAAPGVQRTLDGLALALAFVPLGLLLPAVGRAHRVTLLLTAAGAVPVAAHASGLALPTALESGGLLLGLIVGTALHRFARRET